MGEPSEGFIHSRATKIVLWYDIGGVYSMEPYSVKPPMVLAHPPWSGHYQVRQNLWGYAHYGQFSEVGWKYLEGGGGELNDGGSFVTLTSPGNDYSIIIETEGASSRQQVGFEVGGGLSTTNSASGAAMRGSGLSSRPRSSPRTARSRSPSTPIPSTRSLPREASGSALRGSTTC